MLHTAHIPAQPYPFVLGQKPPCLIIIDMQKDFLEPGGFGEVLGNDVSLLQSAVAPISQLLTTFRKLNLPVIHTREAHQPDLSDCPIAKRMRGNPTLRIGDEGPMGRILIDGEPGNAIIETLAPRPGEYEIVKPGKGAFYNTNLIQILKYIGSEQLIITGVTTEVCVQTTLREANDRGFSCLLAEDGTASYFPEFKQATLKMIVAQDGIVGWVGTSQSIVDTLEAFYG